MIVVAGIFRTGLSMTMQMLHAGGYPCIGSPPAFEEYPLGQIPWASFGAIDPTFAIKVVDTPKQFPTPGIEYDVIRLRRDPLEMVKSFNKFNLAMMGLPPVESRSGVKRLIKSFQRDDKVMDRRFANGGHRVLEVRFEEVLANPGEAAIKIASFLGPISLNVMRAARAVVPRGPECYPTLLELELVERYK